jgi:hypothetical protein
MRSYECQSCEQSRARIVSSATAECSAPLCKRRSKKRQFFAVIPLTPRLRISCDRVYVAAIGGAIRQLGCLEIERRSKSMALCARLRGMVR